MRRIIRYNKNSYNKNRINPFNDGKYLKIDDSSNVEQLCRHLNSKPKQTGEVLMSALSTC